MGKWETPIYLQKESSSTNPAGNVTRELQDAELESMTGAGPNTYSKCNSSKKSCGWACTWTTECPFLSFCC